VLVPLTGVRTSRHIHDARGPTTLAHCYGSKLLDIHRFIDKFSSLWHKHAAE